MSPRRYPTLTPSEVKKILQARNFLRVNTRGSHAYYEATINGKRRVVTVDEHVSQFDDFLLKSMIEQSGLSREEFYGSTKKTAKKIDVPYVGTPAPTSQESD